jgi:hypothetical protein
MFDVVQLRHVKMNLINFEDQKEEEEEGRQR